MIHERGRQYDRLKAEGRLDELLTDNREWSNWKWVLTPFGAIALLIGTALVFAIFWAMLQGGIRAALASPGLLLNSGHYAS